MDMNEFPFRTRRCRVDALSLTAVVLLLDQLTKAIVVARIPLYTVGLRWFDGLIRIIHTRNPAVAFSIGYGIPEPWRGIIFTLLPAAVLIGVGLYYWRSADLNVTQTWMLAGVLGGGGGNLIDRLIRPEGVVDFVDVAFFGLFGLERWPTFNVADAAVVVCGIGFVVSTAIFESRNRPETQQPEATAPESSTKGVAHE
jgi:signal peptidase II